MLTRSLARHTLALAALACLAAPNAHAQDLTYVLSGTASGLVMVPGVSSSVFNNQTFTFTETAPISGVTTNVVPQFNFAGTVNLVLGSNSGTVANFGATIYNFGGTIANAGFSSTNTPVGVIGFTPTAGPLTLTAPQSSVALNLISNPTFTSSFGDVIFTDVSNLTFSSTTPAAVPEPGSLALLTGLTLTGAAFLRHRKLARKAA